jgi:uncharacterized protein (TIRG00374 family)
MCIPAARAAPARDRSISQSCTACPSEVRTSDATVRIAAGLGCGVARLRAGYVFNVITFLIGGIALAIVLDQLGWDGLRRVFIGTGSWFVVIAAIDLASVFCDTFAIHSFLRGNAQVSYWKVFAAEASGIAINRLTPGNTLGEPVKVTMLGPDVPTKVAVAAVLMFNLTTMYVGITAIVIGVPLTVLMLDLPHDVAVAVWIGTGGLVAFGIAVAVLLRRGAIATLVTTIARLGGISDARAERWTTAIADIDARLRNLGDVRASGVARGIAGVFGSRCFNWAGTLAVLHAANIPLTPPLVVAMLSVGIIITWMSNIIPLGLGIADGTNYVLYGILGAAPVAGLVFTMVNRVRTVLFALMGLTVMAIANAFGRSRA